MRSREWEGEDEVADAEESGGEEGERELRVYRLHLHPGFGPDGIALYFNEVVEDGKTYA